MSISTIILPTCSPDKMYKYVMPSLHNLSELNTSFNFAILFQPPYTEEQIKKVVTEIKKFGFDVRYDYGDFRNADGHCEGLLPIRQKTSELYPNSDYYIAIDDDMEFLSGVSEQYKELVSVMDADRNVGVCLLKRENENDNNLYYADIIKTHFWTDATQIFRGGKYYGFEGLYPKEMHNMKGRGEDIARCVWHVSLGESVLIRYDSKVVHYQSSNVLNQYNESNYDWCDNSIYHWLRQFNPMFLRGGKQSGWNLSLEEAKKCFDKGTMAEGLYSKISTEDIVCADNEDTRYLKIHWIMTYWCNYNCSYCTNCIHHQPFTPESQIMEISKNLHKIKTDKKIFLQVLGGEVTFYDLKQVLMNCKDVVDSFLIITNFSKPVEYFEDMYKFCKSIGIKMYLNCSYHIEQNKDYLPKIIELSKWCEKNKFSKPISGVLVDDDFDMNILNILKENNIRIDLQKKRELNDKSPKFNVKTEHELQVFNGLDADKRFRVKLKNGTDIKYNRYSIFINQLSDGGLCPDGFMCDAGINCISINLNGDVVRCACRYLNQFPFGNLITDKEIKLPKEPIECKASEFLGYKDYCPVSWNMKVWKKDSE